MRAPPPPQYFLGPPWSENLATSLTKGKFSSEIYEDEAERICFCSAIAYARSLMLVLMLMPMLMSHTSVDLPVLPFVLPCAYGMLMSLVKTRLKLLTAKKCDFDRQF